MQTAILCCAAFLAATSLGNSASGRGRSPHLPGFVGFKSNLRPMGLVEITLVYDGRRRESFGSLVDEDGLLLFSTPRTVGYVSAYAKPHGGLSKRLVFVPQPQGVWLGHVEFALGDSDENGQIDQRDLDYARKLLGKTDRDGEWYDWDDRNLQTAENADTNRNGRIDASDIATIRRHLGARSQEPPVGLSAVKRLLSGKPLTRRGQ